MNVKLLSPTGCTACTTLQRALEEKGPLAAVQNADRCQQQQKRNFRSYRSPTCHHCVLVTLAEDRGWCVVQPIVADCNCVHHLGRVEKVAWIPRTARRISGDVEHLYDCPLRKGIVIHSVVLFRDARAGAGATAFT